MACNDYIQHADLTVPELHEPKPHTHTTSQITDLAITSPTDDDILVYNSSTGKWENHSVSSMIGTYLVQTEVPTIHGGSDTTFDTANDYQPGTLVVYINGLKELAEKIIEDDDNTFTLVEPIKPAKDYVEVSYIKQ